MSIKTPQERPAITVRVFVAPVGATISIQVVLS